MTARAISHEMDEYLALGANGALSKPFDPMTLSAQVMELWEKFHAK
jgi:CheY-like chemotaxis protein